MLQFCRGSIGGMFWLSIFELEPGQFVGSGFQWGWIFISHNNLMQSLHILVVVLTLWSAAACPDGCLCSGDLCDSCDLGFFNANSNASTPTCLTCPPGCSECENREAPRPFCTACSPDFVNNPQAGTCFKCAVGCADCVDAPDNCGSCVPPFLHIADPDPRAAGSCQPDQFCPEGCLNCEGSDILAQLEQNGEEVTDQMVDAMVSCLECQPGAFLIQRGCFSCPFGCSECTVDTAAFWDEVSMFWTHKFVQINDLFSSSGGAQGNVDMEFTPGNMTDQQKRLWELLFITHKFIEHVQTPDDHVSLAIDQLNRANIIAGSTNIQQHWEEVTLYVNRITQLRLTQQDVQRGITAILQSKSSCQMCANGFVEDGNMTGCVRCDSVCGTCDVDGCTGCKPGFYLDMLTCSPCHPTCKTCSGAGADFCESCLLPLTLTAAGTCIQCSDPCRTCDSANPASCILCKVPFSETAVGGVCHQCDDRRCLECSSTDTSICDKCMQGYILIDGQCQSCQENCVQCSNDVEPICFECIEGYAAVDGQCEQCARGCQICQSDDASVCQVCRPGNYLDYDSGSCMPCEQGCASCSASGCDEFEGGVIQFMGSLVSCDLGCISCDESNPRICYECEEKFYLSGEVCTSCKPGCDSCTDISTCDSCRPGTYDNGGSCDPCGTGCLECISPSECTTCMRGFNENGGVCEKPCAVGCARCDASNAATCLECSAGYSLTSASTCNKCSRQCSGSCDPKDITICTSCPDGFQMKEGECTRCPTGCASCLAENCLTCLHGYKIETVAVNGVTSDICSTKCHSPCKTCSGNKCLTCINGYRLSSGSCVLNTNELCQSGCSYCPQGTQLAASGACEVCATQNCLVCKMGVCQSCRPGNYIDTSGLCMPCPEQCKTCFDEITCDLCASGYYKQLISMDEGLVDAVFSDECSLCSDNCATCFMEAERCLTCKTGYRLTSSNACVGRYEVKMVIEFATELADFISQAKSQELLESIVGYLGLDISQVDMLSLTEGSSVAVVSVSTTGKSQASQIQSSASDTSAMVGSVGSVIYSSVGITYDGEDIESSEEENSKAKTGMIVGIVIGSLVLVAIIAFVAYKIISSKRGHNRVSEASSDMNLQELRVNPTQEATIEKANFTDYQH